MIVITIIWRLYILWQPCRRDPLVDLYSSDVVKGTVQEYIPAFGKCAFKKADCAGHHCKSFLLQFPTWFVSLWANCCFLDLRLTASCHSDKDGDILSAAKTWISMVSEAKCGSDGSKRSWQRLGFFFNTQRKLVWTEKSNIIAQFELSGVLMFISF